MIPDWKDYVKGIDKLFVEIFATFLFVLWKKKIKFSPSKKEISEEECIERLAGFINEHSDNSLPIVDCRICARDIWDELKRKHGGR